MRECECGCGLAAPIAQRSYSKKGWVKGRPLRFVQGHNRETWESRVLVAADGCWVWTGPLDYKGYGRVRFKGRRTSAHRYVYLLFMGQIPEGLTLDHLCRNHACVNPTHLDPVTNAENARRGSNARLTADAVVEIRRSKLRNGEVARQFGVSPQHISDIRHGNCWAGVGGIASDHAPRDIPNNRQAPPSLAKTGVTGVYWEDRRKAWRVSIQINGRRIQRYTPDFDEAVRIRRNWQAES